MSAGREFQVDVAATEKAHIIITIVIIIIIIIIITILIKKVVVQNFTIDYSHCIGL